MESLGSRTQRRQGARAQAKLAKLGNVASSVRTVLYTSGGKHKEGQVRDIVLEQVGLPLFPQKDKRGRVTSIVTSPIRNRKITA